MTSTTMTVHLDPQAKHRLDQLAELTHRSKSFLASDAINTYLETQERQLNEIMKGISEADSEQLTDHERLVSYWESKRD